MCRMNDHAERWFWPLLLAVVALAAGLLYAYVVGLAWVLETAWRAVAVRCFGWPALTGWELLCVGVVGVAGVALLAGLVTAMRR